MVKLLDWDPASASQQDDAITVHPLKFGNEIGAGGGLWGEGLRSTAHENIGSFHLFLPKLPKFSESTSIANDYYWSCGSSKLLVIGDWPEGCTSCLLCWLALLPPKCIVIIQNTWNTQTCCRSNQAMLSVIAEQNWINQYLPGGLDGSDPGLGAAKVGIRDGADAKLASGLKIKPEPGAGAKVGPGTDTLGAGAGIMSIIGDGGRLWLGPEIGLFIPGSGLGAWDDICLVWGLGTSRPGAVLIPGAVAGISGFSKLGTSALICGASIGTSVSLEGGCAVSSSGCVGVKTTLPKPEKFAGREYCTEVERGMTKG